ncbi:MAG TPA: ATP-binding protein [Archangium sp.]|uniref:PAS domain-containing sensor histidine kinase n=1 Tax=Archangium sp. TaxID=1872627 RepID=UPI002ED9267C
MDDGGATKIEELIDLVNRLAANEPNIRCQPGEGPLAPLAAALNNLSATLDARRTTKDEPFGVEVLVAQSPILMMACDADERVRFMNYTIPGLSPAEVVGKSYYHFTPPEDVEMVRGYVRRVLATGEPVSYEHRPNLSFGGPEWFGVQVGPIRSGEQVIGFTVSLTDITALKRTQLRLEQSNRELENFASVASHDLQEPLRKIQTFSDHLAATYSQALGPEGRDLLSRMNNAAKRMRQLIDDLLAYSRISSRAQSMLLVDLSEIARGVVGDLESTIEQTGAKVTIGELPTLEASPIQMRQLLQNLLSNALKFRRDDVAPIISVQATVDPESKLCELRVEDNGIGFDEKYVDRIFNVFQRLHGRGKYEGTGIGLAICRKIAERHGGSIRARSTPGQGSTFIVTLPVKMMASR